MRTRIVVVLVITTVVFLFLASRLFYLQVLDSQHMLKKVSLQRLISVPVKNTRGTIYDRNFIPFTNKGEKTNMIVIPQLIEKPERVAKIISHTCDIEYTNLLEKIKRNKPFKYIIDHNKSIDIKEEISKGVLIVKTRSRYSTDSIARHVIGYVDANNKGIHGIEKGYDSCLRTKQHKHVGILGDAVNRPLIGLGYRVVNTHSQQGKSVKLTLDYHFQKIIENSFDKYSYEGAAVLLDSKTGDILAMVSRPNYNTNNISKYFKSSNQELINKALYPYNLGSIFKIVIAYAALKEGIVDTKDTFYCPGYTIVDGQLKKCASFNTGGHGEISFTEAFAHSCNTAFIEVGLKLGYNKIINTAQKFGLGQKIGLEKHGFNEKSGLMPHKKYVSKRETANVSIGQGDILVTPVQVARLINIVANDGMQKKINIVDSIIDNQGNQLKKIGTHKEYNKLSKKYIRIIKNMMRKVVKTGTGSKINLSKYGGAAGKTSSAETGIYTADKQIIHAWFGGFFPSDNPQYTLAIIIENGHISSKTAAPLFEEIAKKILKTNVLKDKDVHK